MCASRCGRHANGTGSLFNRTNLTIVVLFLSLLPSNDAAPTLKLNPQQQQQPRNIEIPSEPLPTKITESSTFKTIDANKMADKFVPPSIAAFTSPPHAEHDATSSHAMPPVSLSNVDVIENKYTAAVTAAAVDATTATTRLTIPSTTTNAKEKIENDKRTDFLASKSLPSASTTSASAATIVRDDVNKNQVNGTTESVTWPTASSEPNSSDLSVSTVLPTESSNGISTENVQRMETGRSLLSQSETPASLNDNGGTSTPTSLTEIDDSSAKTTTTLPTPTKLKFPLNADDDVPDNDDTIRTKSISVAAPVTTTIIATLGPIDGEGGPGAAEHQPGEHSTTNASIKKTLDVKSSSMATVKSHRIGEIIKSSDVEKVVKKHKHDMAAVAATATASDHNNKRVNHKSDASDKEKPKKKLSNENGDTEPTTEPSIDGNSAPDSTIASSMATTTTTEAPTPTTTASAATSTVSETFFNFEDSTIAGVDGVSSSAPDKSHNDSWRIATMSSSTPSTVNITELVAVDNTISVVPVTPRPTRFDEGKMVWATVRPSNALEIERDGKLNAAVKPGNIPSNDVTEVTPPEMDRSTMIPTPPRLNATEAIVPPRDGAILDYDKSSEELFDETSTVRTATSTRGVLLAKIKPYEMDSDELFLPADDFDPADAVAATSSTIRLTETSTALLTSPSTEASTTTQTKESTVERDSDTIFYISNTEVKVVESSVPTPNTKQENQFFPALYEEDVLIDFHSKNNSGWNGLSGGGAGNAAPAEKYEEDIILSPMKNNFDPTKINNEDALNLGYVGESFMDVKDSEENVGGGNGGGGGAGDSVISSNVIIEPVVIPDVQSQSIGVPIIGELPPQIDLQDLQDYKADTMQLNQTENTITSHLLPHVGDNLQKMQQLSAELPKISGGSGEATANVAAKRADEKIQVKPIELAQTPFSSLAPSIELQKQRSELELLEQQRQLTNGTQTPGKNATAEAITNVTAYTVLDDEPEHSKFWRKSM